MIRKNLLYSYSDSKKVSMTWKKPSRHFVEYFTLRTNYFKQPLYPEKRDHLGFFSFVKLLDSIIVIYSAP